MKRLAVTLCAVVASIWSMGALASGVGVVDMEQIFRTSPEVKKINDNLTSEFATRKSKIIEMGKTLQSDLQGYQKNRAVMDKKQQMVQEQTINKKEVDLRNEQMKFQQDLFAAQNKKMSDFMLRIRNIVKNIASQKKLDLVLPKNMVLFSEGAMDITQDVMKKL